MRKLKINRSDFELAFEIGADEAAAFLDTETGTVVLVTEDVEYQLNSLSGSAENLDNILAAIQSDETMNDSEREHLGHAARVKWGEKKRYLKLPKQVSRDGYQEMQDFIASLEDEHLREVLETAIRGSGAFRRFKDALRRHDEVEEAWYKFRDTLQQRRILDWLKSKKIEPEFE